MGRYGIAKAYHAYYSTVVIILYHQYSASFITICTRERHGMGRFGIARLIMHTIQQLSSYHQYTAWLQKNWIEKQLYL
jgi:hypothetical protein